MGLFKGTPRKPLKSASARRERPVISPRRLLMPLSPSASTLNSGWRTKKARFRRCYTGSQETDTSSPLKHSRTNRDTSSLPLQRRTNRDTSSSPLRPRRHNEKPRNYNRVVCPSELSSLEEHAFSDPQPEPSKLADDAPELEEVVQPLDDYDIPTDSEFEDFKNTGAHRSPPRSEDDLSQATATAMAPYYTGSMLNDLFSPSKQSIVHDTHEDGITDDEFKELIDDFYGCDEKSTTPRRPHRHSASQDWLKFVLNQSNEL